MTPSFRLRRLLPLVHDLFVAGIAAAAAIVLRVGLNYRLDDPDFFWHMALAFMAVSAPVYLVTGSYRTSWRFVSVREAIALARAAVLTNLLFFLVMFFATRLDAVPRSVLIINTLLLTALLISPRLVYRLLREGRISLDRGLGSAEPLLLYGAAGGADLFLRALEGRRAPEWRAVGLIDDNPERRGTRLRGVPVLGASTALTEILETLEASDMRPHRLVVTDPGLPRAELRRLVDAAKPLALTVSRVPLLTDLHSGGDTILSVRPIAIEDLLGRPPANLDLAPVEKLVRGRRVMVTGAGGSIGSELVRQLSRLEPASMSLLDCAEAALYEIDLEWKELAPQIPAEALLIDVRHRERVRRAFADARPELVFHAAAFKHVPLVEANPVEGAWTNVLGTRNVADAAQDAGAQAMVLISTDKAVNPSSVMGATKRMAEAYCQSLDLASDTTRFVTVRFGNVLGSNGSVVPLFRRQLAKGGPLTVTHPEMRRYFMIIPEAVSLVLQASAAALSGNGMAGRIHVLDMGEQIKIVDLAREMIRLAGLEPERDIEIIFTGPRPGEKLEEELFHDHEALASTSVPGVHLAAPRILAPEIVTASLSALERSVAAGDPEATLAAIRMAVPEFKGSVLDLKR